MSAHSRSSHHVPADYFILLLILIIGFFTFNNVTGRVDKQLEVGFVVATAYAVWGIFHHIHEGDLHWKIMIEYSSFALFGFALLWLLLVVFA